MSEEKNDQNQASPLTKREKRVLLGETTFVSLGFVATIIIGVVYTVNIDGKTNANAKALSRYETQLSAFRTQYLKQMETYTKEIKELNSRMGRIEGKLDAIKK